MKNLNSQTHFIPSRTVAVFMHVFQLENLNKSFILHLQFCLCLLVLGMSLCVIFHNLLLIFGFYCKKKS